MIRYAPNPQNALKFSAYLLKQDLPLRTKDVERSSLMDPIFVYSRGGSHDSMGKALELIKLGFERQIYKMTYRARTDSDNVGMIFLNISKKVFRYHNLQFSADKSRLELIPQRSTRPNRFSTN